MCRYCVLLYTQYVCKANDTNWNDDDHHQNNELHETMNNNSSNERFCRVFNIKLGKFIWCGGSQVFLCNQKRNLLWQATKSLKSFPLQELPSSLFEFFGVIFYLFRRFYFYLSLSLFVFQPTSSRCCWHSLLLLTRLAAQFVCLTRLLHIPMDVDW